jgi:predicted ester cyclase
MTREEKVSLIERLHSLWNTGDLAAIPSIYAPDFVAHMPKGWMHSPFIGHDGVREAILRIRAAFSDWTEIIEDVIVEGDRVVTRYVSTGSHVGPFIGLSPTGRTIRLDEISIFRLVGDQVAEQWCLVDDLSLARQLRGPRE